MPMRMDSHSPVECRIPVVFGRGTDGATAGGTDGAELAWLVEAGVRMAEGVSPVATFSAPEAPDAAPDAARGHAAFCACCVPRGAAAAALGRLFLARARGEVAFFSRLAVAATPAGEAAVRAALAGDPLVRARYRTA